MVQQSAGQSITVNNIIARYSNARRLILKEKDSNNKIEIYAERLNLVMITKVWSWPETHRE
ncbi:protein of unknown function [Legionella fallonii LLAP-10]|uniref:Uncharacterized protein n=1 Tax=Legionella fallonii LLAP-10 TaxID=1212491 RepID=A0A098G077_9GAMM|nr:protein of unknown function [Legionella fallonii LLAP-10]